MRRGRRDSPGGTPDEPSPEPGDTFPKWKRSERLPHERPRARGTADNNLLSLLLSSPSPPPSSSSSSILASPSHLITSFTPLAGEGERALTEGKRRRGGFAMHGVVPAEHKCAFVWVCVCACVHVCVHGREDERQLDSASAFRISAAMCSVPNLFSLAKAVRGFLQDLGIFFCMFEGY